METLIGVPVAVPVGPDGRIFRPYILKVSDAVTIHVDIGLIPYTIAVEIAVF